MTSDLTLIMHGIGLTLMLTIVSLLIGFFAACITTYGALSTAPVIRKTTLSYIAVIRGTPLLLQVFFIYYGLSQSLWIQHGFMWHILKYPVGCALFALANNSTAYVSNLLIGAIQKIPKAQIDAAKTLGLKKSTVFLSIQLPYAIKHIVPYYKNEMIMLLKATSLVSTITCLDLTGAVNQIISLDYQNLKWYGISALIYLGISFVLYKAYNLIFSKVNSGSLA